MPSVRSIFLLIAIACAGLIGTALYMQYVMLIEPCYMCILQRIAFMFVGLFSLLCAIHNPSRLGLKIYASLTALFALGGAFFAGKQVWLQHLPEDQIPDCGAAVSYLFEVQPFFTALAKLLQGDGSCAEVKWVFLGLSIPGWTLIFFVGIAVVALWQIRRKK